MSATEEKPTAPATEEEKMPDLEPVVEKKGEEKKGEEKHAHSHAHGHDHKHEEEDDRKVSKAEKKARKAAKALGLHEVQNCTNMNVRGEKGTFFSISKPEVFRVGNTNNYIVFGRMRMEDPTAHAGEEAAKQFGQAAGATPAAPSSAEISDIVSQITKETEQNAAAPQKEEEEDGEVDMTGLNPDEVIVIMTQANVSKKKAVEALRANDGDYIQAIISLSSN